MTARRVGALLVAALLIVGLGLSLSSRKISNTDVGAGQPVIPELKAQLNAVSEIRIKRGDGSTVTLRQRPKDWLVVEREFPADTGKVRKLLLDLSSLESVEAKTSDPGKYSQLGVEDVDTPASTGTLVELVTPEEVHGVIIGRTSGIKSGYVRAAGAGQSVLASPQIIVEADPKRWLDTALVDIPQVRIKEVEVQPETGRAYRVTRENAEQADFAVPDLPKGRELESPGAANPVAGSLALLTFTDVRRAPEPVDARSAKPEHAVFRTFDGLELQFDGVRDADRRYVSVTARSSAKETAEEAGRLEARTKGWQFEIPNYKYDGLFRPLDELLKEPESSKK